MLIEPTTGEAQRLHTLEGNFEPEAFSRDGEDLFLVEYVPADEPTGYRVRQLNLATGRVRPVESPDIDAADVMGGTARSQVMSADGTRLYTLYSIPPGADGDGHGITTEGRAFVHVLDLEEKWAHCLDLPAPFGRDLAASGPMAINDDGTELFVVDPGWEGRQGNVIAVDTVHLAPGEVARAGLAPWTTAAAVGPDGALYVAGQRPQGGGRVQVIDTGTMGVTSSWRTTGLVNALAVTDANDLLVLEDGALSVMAPDGGGRRSISVPEGGALAVGPGSITLPGPRDVLECAC